MTRPAVTAHRGRVLHCLRDPGADGDTQAVEYFADGVLLVSDGRIAALAPAEHLLPTLGPDVERVEHGDRLILPGMIDCHVHYAQTDIVAAYGGQLLDWLTQHVFPMEARFSDAALATQTAEFFLDELLRNGTTTALVFATVHPVSVDAIFTAAQHRGMRLAAGKVMMDRHCPPHLRDGPRAGFRDTLALIEKWHKRGRLRYAVTPRFAPACSGPLLDAAGELAARFDDVLVHTHLAENRQEVAWVRELFPERNGYLDVYRHYGLLHERCVFAHCLHLDDADYQALAGADAALAFCPSSNLYLGSGLFDLARARGHGLRTGIASDVGGGTSLSLLRTLSDGYKALQLGGQPLAGLTGLYLATLGAARTLRMDDCIGNFAVGKEADFCIADTSATASMARRVARAPDIADEFFALMMLGDDRAIAATYILGEQRHTRDGCKDAAS